MAKTNLFDLRKQWVVFVVVSAFVFTAGFLVLQKSWTQDAAYLWLAGGIIIFLYEAGMIWQALDQNHRPGEMELLPRFGPGSALSLARGVIVAFLAGFLLVARPPGALAWMPAILKIIADFTDFFDGIAARLSNHATRLGETLDLNLDGLGMLVVTLLAFQYSTVPWWYLPVGFARYLFIFGLWWRQWKNKPVYELQPSAARRGLAALQMGFGTAALFPIFSPPATTIAATLFMLPFLTGFTYDWLQVSGRLRPVSQRQKNFWAGFWHFASRWLPILLRIGIIALTSLRLVVLGFDFVGEVIEYEQLGLSHAVTWVRVFAGLETFFMLMVAMGAAGRPVAVFALLTLGTRLQFDPFTPDYFWLLVFYVALLFLGTGRLSLWRPVDKLIHRRIGEPE